VFEPLGPWQGSSMLDWIADWILKIATAGPAWIFEDGSVNFMLFRAIAAVMVIIFTLYLIAIFRK
jgi:hypothetical protein